MLVGEFNYSSDLNFTHWLGYVIFALFVFLVVIVLMNVLNGLAVRDISLIMEEMDTYHNISIVETLSSTIFLRLVAQEILIFPNTKPKRQTFLKIPIMGQKVIITEPRKVKSFEITLVELKGTKLPIYIGRN
jgi:hypothetical protein